MPACGCQPVDASRWMPAGGCQQVDDSRWMPASGCQQVDASRWMPLGGCQQVDASRRMPAGGCQQVDASRWMPASGCQQLDVGPQQDRGKRNLQRQNFLVCFPNSVSSGSSLSFTLLLVNLATRTGLLPRLRPNSLGNNTVSDALLRTRNPRPVSWNKTGQIVLVLLLGHPRRGGLYRSARPSVCLL